jgi:hypothetical protein
MTFKHLLSKRRNNVKKNSLAISIIIWFLAFFIYYSKFAAYYETRYSVEFLFPAFFITTFGVKILGDLFISWKKGKIIRTAILVIFFLLVLSSEYNTLSTLSITDEDIDQNYGFKKVAEWINNNLSFNDTIASNSWVYLRWYSKRANILPAPQPLEFKENLKLLLQTLKEYLAENNIKYMAYICPENTGLDDVDYLKKIWSLEEYHVAIYI